VESSETIVLKMPELKDVKEQIEQMKKEELDNLMNTNNDTLLNFLSIDPDV
jgi:hypothetical protein